VIEFFTKFFSVFTWNKLFHSLLALLTFSAPSAMMNQPAKAKAPSYVTSTSIAAQPATQTSNVSVMPMTKISTTDVHSITRNRPLQYAHDIPILTYHHLLPDSVNKAFKNNKEVISTEEFEEQMKLLHDNGYESLTLNELEQFLDGEIHLPKRSVVITFDDGYLSNFVYAYPILKKYHFKATLFAVKGFISTYPEVMDPNKLNFISWPEIPKHEDVFAIGSHTCYLHHLDKKHKSFLVVKPPKEVEADLVEARKTFHSNYFAYPYGQFNKTTILLLKKAGYHLAFTTKPGRVSVYTSKFELNRNDVFPTTDINEFRKIVGLNYH
jgi:peptidoglycan/xylan/chitin deacetylase (PgdA/CDA1 family)